MSDADETISDLRLAPAASQEPSHGKLGRARLIQALREIEARPEGPRPVSDEELDRLVHQARREILRARGL